LDSLGNAKYLSSLDIRSAYWKIPLDEESRPLTAFSVTGRGQFQFKGMPFGLHSAAGTFQALVDRLFKKTRFVWSTECERAFSEVKNALINAPILSCPDFNHPFTLQCDACDIGIGAVLTQNFNGNERVIYYLSRALSLTERKYSTTEKECLSVIYAIKRLRCYLEGTRFTVITDHYSLLWLNNLKDPLGRLGRWVMRLQAFDFNIVHRKGKDNVIVRYGASKESETPYFLEGCVTRTLATAVPPPPDSVLPGRPSI
jgi:hypothetical protein